VFALYDVLWNTSPLLSPALGGIVAEVADVRVVYIGAGLLMFAAEAVGLRTPVAPPSHDQSE